MTENVYPEGGLLCLPGESHGQTSLASYSPKSQILKQLSTCWRRQWNPTPVLLPGESQGWGSLVGCRIWGRTELDTTEVT